MIQQVFDTHRLSYRNAKIRAYSLSEPSRAIDFYNVTGEAEGQWDNIGTEVQTNENGYLCYGSGQSHIVCLAVAEAAIIMVSLDGGQNWPIQWTLIPSHDPSALRTDDIYGLKYWDENGQQAVFNPAIGAAELPKYLLAKDYAAGDWAEQDLIIEADDTLVDATPWTRVIVAYNTATCTVKLPYISKFRAGQVVTIRAQVETGLIIAGTNWQFKAYHTYLAFNVGNGISVVDITIPDVATFCDIKGTDPVSMTATLAGTRTYYLNGTRFFNKGPNKNYVGIVTGLNVTNYSTRTDFVFAIPAPTVDWQYATLQFDGTVGGSSTDIYIMFTDSAPVGGRTAGDLFRIGRIAAACLGTVDGNTVFRIAYRKTGATTMVVPLVTGRLLVTTPAIPAGVTWDFDIKFHEVADIIGNTWGTDLG